MVLQLLHGMASECEHKDCGDWQVNTSPGNTCFAFYANIHVSPPLRNNSRLFFSARVMDLESVMCELAGTSNTSIVPLLSLEKEQFMCQVSHFCKQGQRQRHNEERQNTKSQTALRGRTSRVRSVVKRDLGSPGRSRARCTRRPPCAMRHLEQHGHGQGAPCGPHVQCDISQSTWCTWS